MRKRLMTFVLMLAFMLSMVYAPSISSAKSVDDYEWSDEQLPIIIGDNCPGMSSTSGGEDTWTSGYYASKSIEKALEFYPDDLVVEMGINKNMLGEYKMVLQWGSKFASMGRGGIGSWTTLDDALSEAGVIEEDAIPFNFNYAGSTTQAEYDAAIESSYILVFDKNNNSCVKAPLTKLDNIVTSEAGEDEYLKTKSSVEAKVNGKTDKGYLRVDVSWKLAKKDMYLTGVAFDVREGTLISGDLNKSEGSCTYEIAIDYNFGVSRYEAKDSLGNSYFGEIDISNIFEKNIAGEVVPKSDPSETKENKMVRPKVTVKGIPKEVSVGDSFKVLLSTDVSATMSLNGMSNGGYHKSNKFDITSNGTYTYRAVSKSGGITEGTFEVKCFKGQS